MREKIEDIIKSHKETIQKISDKTIDQIEEAIKAIISAFKQGNKLIVFGNGGSAADAQHLAAEFINKFKIDRDPLPAIALTTDTSAITAIGNDSGFEFIFEKQIKALGKQGDVAIAITTSDVNENHSVDVYLGLLEAREKGIKTIGLVSEKSKKILKAIDIPIVIPSKETPRIQEMHLLAYHIICELIEKEMSKNKRLHTEDDFIESTPTILSGSSDILI
ncbi:MAG: SIS domain-containing protein [Thermoplasmatales archaeon]|nr:MAG: SIS domain-containing protein [Thermoplasmatales archaeon]